MSGAAWILAVATIVVPCAALLLGGGGPTWAVRPFGFPEWVIVHALCAAPLAWLLGRMLPGRAGGRSGWGWLAVAVAAAAATIALGPALAGRSTAGSFAAGHAQRVAWVVLLLVPWRLAAEQLARGDAVRVRPRPAGLLLALVAAALVPLVFVHHALRQQTGRLAELLADQKLPAARLLAQRLSEAGADGLLGRNPAAWGLPAAPGLLAADVEQSLAALTVAVAQSLPAGAGEQATLERAHLLAMLGRTDAARELMRPWMERSSSAALLWAMLERDEGRWESSDEGFRRALEQMRRERAAGSQGLPPQGLRAPYDGLAFNARAQRQPQVAEQLYRQALAELPEDEAYFRFQLGLHYQLGGRPLEAQAELAAAARLDAEAYGEPARQLIDRLRVETPACLVPLPRGR